MLGKLARWLRVLGYDTVYEKIVPDEQLIARALRHNRWVLTRDGCLARRNILHGRHTLITSDHLDGQLRQLRDELHLSLEPSTQRPYRCVRCNALLVRISQEAARPLVPPFVAAQYRNFTRCPDCGAVYWPGTHWDTLINRLDRINDGGESGRR